MVQKYLAMVAILGAIAALSIGMVTTQAKAFERTCHYWSNGDSQCEWGPYFSYTQHPTIQSTGYYTHVGSHLVFVDSGQCPCGDAPGAGYACNNCNSFTQQAQIQLTSFRPDNCFWSYPVQCN